MKIESDGTTQSREQLRTAYTLPGAFRAYKPLLL